MSTLSALTLWEVKAASSVVVMLDILVLVTTVSVSGPIIPSSLF